MNSNPPKGRAILVSALCCSLLTVIGMLIVFFFIPLSESQSESVLLDAILLVASIGFYCPVGFGQGAFLALMLFVTYRPSLNLSLVGALFAAGFASLVGKEFGIAKNETSIILIHVLPISFSYFIFWFQARARSD